MIHLPSGTGRTAQAGKRKRDDVLCYDEQGSSDSYSQRNQRNNEQSERRKLAGNKRRKRSSGRDGENGKPVFEICRCESK